MQRLSGDFLVKRVVTVYGQGGAVMELYELPNGQWQFGKGKDATVVTDMAQIDALPQIEEKPAIDAETRKAIAEWVERVKHQAAPRAVQQGQTPMLAGQSARDRLGRAISVMSDEVINRLLTAIENTVGPVADSLNQGAQTNSHSDGYGQDQHMSAPGSVEARPFVLPEGARWVDPKYPASGYLTEDTEIRDERGNPTVRWHPTPDFHAVTERADPEPILETTPLKVHQGSEDVAQEMERERTSRGGKELAGSGGRSGGGRRR